MKIIKNLALVSGGLIIAGSLFFTGYFVAKNRQILASEGGSGQYASSSITTIKGKFQTPVQSEANFNLFWDVWKLLEKEYVNKDKLSEKDMLYGAIHGMVAATNDPYTVFMDPKQAQSFSDDMAGTFEGIGAEIGLKKNQLVVIAPLPGTPAEKAGIRAGDAILAINGSSTQGMSTDQAVSLIRGPKNTEVVLRILHLHDTKDQEIRLRRDAIVVKSVRTEYRADGIFVIKVSNFNNDTESLFNLAVSEAIAKKPKGLILDLRNNPGGYLDTAIAMASKWIKSGVVVSEHFHDGSINEYKADGSARLENMKTIVLVNQGSASASEIVSGALQDYGKAIILGKQTFGKGSVQVLENLPDGSSLKVTIAKWYTPHGMNISEKGITPDKEVDYTPKDYENNLDPQLDAAVKLLIGTPVKK
jgi:carboxyl-terminal processing protease